MSNRSNTSRQVAYGYGIEFLLSGLVFALLWQCGLLAVASKFVDESAGSWATFFGLMLAGAMAARLVFFSLNSGDFSAWLEWKNIGHVISGAFLFNLLLFLAVTATSVVLIYVKGTWLSNLGVLVGILGLINCVTFPALVYRLTRLQAVFNFEFKKATEAKKGKA